MFSAQELEWIEALIETMRGKGYKYYVAHTVTENNNDADAVVVFSKEPVVGNGLYSFTVSEGVRYTLDSSGYSSYQGGGARTAVDAYSGRLNVADTEFVYTNAQYAGSTLQPDIRMTGGVAYESTQTATILVAMLLLFVVFYRLFGGKR